MSHIDYSAEVRTIGFHADREAVLSLSDFRGVVEVNLREGGRLSGVTPALGVPDAYMLANGYAYYELGSDALRFGPGRKSRR